MNSSQLSSTLLDVTARGRAKSVALLESLVNFDTSSYAQEGLERASHWIADNLHTLGMTVERSGGGQTAPLLIGRLQGSGRHRILLLAHFDTVFEPGEPVRRPFRIDGDRAFGPGVADMKGGIVTAWEAIRALAEIGWRNFGELTIIHNADEEIGSPGSRAAIEAAGRQADVCLVAEPGRPDGSVVTARKGIARFTLRIRGKAAHAGVNPQDGASAVVDLAHKVLALYGLNDGRRGITVNSVVLEGGTRSNVVPETAVGEVDVRFVSSVDGEEVLTAVERIAESVYLPGTASTLEGGLNRPPMEAASGTALFKVAADAAAALGIPLRGTATGGGSDGNFVAHLGVPVLDGLGAVGGGFHSAGEYLELPTISQRAALMASILWEISRRDTFLRLRP